MLCITPPKTYFLCCASTLSAWRHGERWGNGLYCGSREHLLIFTQSEDSQNERQTTIEKSKHKIKASEVPLRTNREKAIQLK